MGVRWWRGRARGRGKGRGGEGQARNLREGASSAVREERGGALGAGSLLLFKQPVAPAILHPKQTRVCAGHMAMTRLASRPHKRNAPPTHRNFPSTRSCPDSAQRT